MSSETPAVVSSKQPKPFFWEPYYFVVDKDGTVVSEHKVLANALEKMKKMKEAVGVAKINFIERK